MTFNYGINKTMMQDSTKYQQIALFAAMLLASTALAVWGYPRVHPGYVLYRQAEALLEKGAGDQALITAEAAAAEERLRPEDWVRLGALSLEQGRGADAYKYFNLALEQKNNRPRPSLYRMTTQLDMAGFWKSALELYNEHPEAVTDSQDIMYLADLQRRNAEFDKAIGTYEQLINQSDTFGKPATIQARLAKAETLGWQGDFASAIPEVERVLKDNPDNPTAQLLLARLLSWAGRPEESIRLYKQYLGETS